MFSGLAAACRHHDVVHPARAGFASLLLDLDGDTCIAAVMDTSLLHSGRRQFALINRGAGKHRGPASKAGATAAVLSTSARSRAGPTSRIAGSKVRAGTHRRH